MATIFEASPSIACTTSTCCNPGSALTTGTTRTGSSLSMDLKSLSWTWSSSLRLVSISTSVINACFSSVTFWSVCDPAASSPGVGRRPPNFELSRPAMCLTGNDTGSSSESMLRNGPATPGGSTSAPTPQMTRKRIKP